MSQTSQVFPNGTYLLYDDDCGVCTTFSHFFKRLLGDRAELVPMHIPQVEKMGMDNIPESYWTSFHIVQDGRWTTEGEAIIALSGLFPLGSILSKIAAFPPIHKLLLLILSRMQATRKAECTINFS